jgi:UDP-N-acetylglucosamine:LPS N-acetylglucosamine transferase
VEDLSEKLRLVLKTPAKARAMADQALKTGKPNASKNIIKTIEILLGKNQ